MQEHFFLLLVFFSICIIDRSAIIVNFRDVYDPLPKGTIWHPYLCVLLMPFFLFDDPLFLAVASHRSSAIITNDYFALVHNIDGYADLELALANVGKAPVLLVESDGLEGVLGGRDILEAIHELVLMEN